MRRLEYAVKSETGQTFPTNKLHYVADGECTISALRGCEIRPRVPVGRDLQVVNRIQR